MDEEKKRALVKKMAFERQQEKAGWVFHPR